MHIQKIMIIIVYSIFFSACSLNAGVSHNLTFDDGSIKINCKINKIIVKEYSEKEMKTFNLPSEKSTFIYGNLQLTNSSNSDVKYNLNDYHLVIGNKESSKFAIDSVANYLITEKMLKSHQTLKNEVYWVFEGVVEKTEIKSSKLVKMSR